MGRMSYGDLDTKCIERVVGLGSARPWRALGGAECRRYDCVWVVERGEEEELGRIVIYRERAV